jgi:hypothetical protein
LATKNKNAILALRVDFFNDEREVTKSVLWASSILDRDRKRALPWGKGGALADVIADGFISLDGETTLGIANYAPKNWNRKAILIRVNGHTRMRQIWDLFNYSSVCSGEWCENCETTPRYQDSRPHFA